MGRRPIPRAGRLRGADLLSFGPPQEDALSDRIRALTLTVVLLALPATSIGDIHVDIPPGLPSEWSRPRPLIIERAVVPIDEPWRRSSSVEMIPKGSSVVYLRQRVNGAFDTAFNFSGITTIDLPGHIRWSPPARNARYLPVSEHGGIPFVYPPYRSPHLHWKVVAMMLYGVLHPNVTSDVAVAEQLVTLGAPARAVALNAVAREPNHFIGKQLIRLVTPLPLAPPAVSGGKTHHERLLHRLARDQLASSHPDDPEHPFAERLLSLGDEALPAILHYSEQKHLLLRRNAAAALARYSSPKATSRLQVLITDGDRVTRNRAIRALAERRDRGAVGALLNLMGRPSIKQGKDLGSATLILDAIGRIGDPDSASLLDDWLANFPDQPDVLWAVIPALARMPQLDPTSAKLLRHIQKVCLANEQRWARPRGWEPDEKVKHTTRALVVAGMCRMALAAHGDAGEREAFLRQVRKRKRPGAGDGRKVKQLTRGEVLSGVTRPNVYLAIEVLARLGKAGHALIREVIEDATEDASVRAHAMAHLDLSHEVPFLEVPAALGKLARSDELEGADLLRARALRRAESLDAKAAAVAAEAFVADYADGRPTRKRVTHMIPVMIALRILGRLRGGPGAVRTPEQVKQLIAVVKRARAEREMQDDRLRKAAHKRDPSSPSNLPLIASPPLLEVALLELGRTGHPDALPVLLAQLRPGQPARAEAALALGTIGGPKVIKTLLALLTDPLPWTRFSAYRALRALTRKQAEPEEADWLTARPAALKAARKRWQQRLP